LISEIRHIAERPTLNEMRERLHRRESVELTESAAVAVRAERGAR
jgi:hypothetical protein